MTKIETLKDRIEKNEIKIEKKTATIEKKQKSIEKKIASLLKKFNYQFDGWKSCNDIEEKGFNREQAWEIYWEICDIEHLEDDLKRLPKEIEEITAIVEKQKEQLSGEIKKESIFITEIPEAMKEMENELVKEWNEWDRNRRERLRKKLADVGYAVFMKGTKERHFWDKHTVADYEFTKLTDEEIDKENKKLARQEVLDLYIRVKNITGDVTDWSGIKLASGNQFPVLNGKVVGKTGRAYVESVLAGGYNIQRLHVRTLVKEIN